MSEKKYALLPADDAVQNWFENNIDKDCSASSAIYKFRLWLEAMQPKNESPAEQPVRGVVDPQELWDEYSAMIGEDLDDLNYWSGKEVIDKEDFFKALQQFKEQKEK